ncbi:hypothetical protein PMAYCL1PPCAC_14178, partial [Pristionchus mayeri]
SIAASTRSRSRLWQPPRQLRYRPRFPARLRRLRSRLRSRSRHRTESSATNRRCAMPRRRLRGRYGMGGVTPQTAHYKQAVALMKILKRNNYLENALRFEEGEKIRKHYEAVGFNQPPPPHILALLNKALDFVLESVLFRAEDLDTGITNEMRVFIIKKQE